jgi:hypothetical protein
MQTRTKILFSLVLVLILGAVLASLQARPAEVVAAPAVFASPINGGCYIAAANQCRIHVDPFTVNVASASKLKIVKLVANNVTIYDFRTDVSNPPPFTGTTYSPSLVAQDFGATCGQTYTINLEGQDSLDSNLFNLGSTSAFTCPSGLP